MFVHTYGAAPVETSPLATENLLENTDDLLENTDGVLSGRVGAFHQCSPGAAACSFRICQLNV